MVLTYSLSYLMPKGTLADALSLSIYNVFNNQQVTQFNEPGSPYATNAKRCVSLGFNRAF